MKKYTILDSDGQKKIVYAPNMKKALRYVGDGEKTAVKDSKFYVVLSNYDYTKEQAEKDARKYGLKLQILGPANGSKQETEAYLVGPRANIVRMLKETDMDEFEGDIEDSVKDSKVKDEDDYFYFDADEDDRSLDDYKRIMRQCGLTITKVEGNSREAFIYYRGSSSAEQKAAKMLGISLEDSIGDSKVKDADALEGEYRTKYGDRLIVSKIDASTYSYFDADTRMARRVSINALKEDIKAKRLIKEHGQYKINFDSKVKDAGLKTYKTIDYFAENGYYKVYVKNRNKNGDQPIKHLAEALGLKTSPIGYFTKDRIYAPPYAKEYLVEGTNKDAIIKFCETLDPKLAPLKGHIKDADTNIVDKLISEEEKAVMDYKEALMADSDLSANAVYAHILTEELEHLRELSSLREQPSLGDSIDDAKWSTYNAVNYKFERNYWHIFSIFNRIEMLDNDVRALARKLNLIVEPYDKYSFKRHNKNDKDVYYDDYRVKGKDKDNVIKFCETLNPLVKPLKFE